MRCMFFEMNEGRGLSMSKIGEVSDGYIIPNSFEPGKIGVMFEDNLITNVNMPAFLSYETEKITVPIAFECEHGMLDIPKYSECLDKVCIWDIIGGKKEPVIIPSENGTFYIDFVDKQ